MNFLSLFTVFTENKCVKFKENDYGKSEKPRRNVGKKNWFASFFANQPLFKLRRKAIVFLRKALW